MGDISFIDVSAFVYPGYLCCVDSIYYFGQSVGEAAMVKASDTKLEAENKKLKSVVERLIKTPGTDEWLDAMLEAKEILYPALETISLYSDPEGSS